MEVIVRGGTIVSMDSQWTVAKGDVASIDGVLVQVGGDYVPQTDNYQIVDASDAWVIPGFVQTHTHMCQTLARGAADDLELLDWLSQRIWPYEGALTPEQMTLSAQVASTELLLGGTTTILDMGSVHHTEQLFEVADAMGLRAFIGKAMMDVADARIPASLQESTQESIDESNRLCKQWNSHARLSYAYAPRFALSCTKELLEEVSRIAPAARALIHTHASENPNELAEVKRQTGLRNIEYLHSVGMLGEHVAIAHCIWLDTHERELLQSSGTHVLHCPSSNLKLGSGTCEVTSLLEQGISVSFGADGAPCNNRLDMFWEMRLASLLQKPMSGPQAMSAERTLWLATMGGAHALGLGDEIGSLEVGKKADVVVVDNTGVHNLPSMNPYSQLVYSAGSRDVRHVIVDGTPRVRDGRVPEIDLSELTTNARKAAKEIFSSL